jgi:hypothetical protein
MGIEGLANEARGEKIMTTTIGWRDAVAWSLLGLMFLLFALVIGPAPALAKDADLVLYEVTEDMYLKDAAGNFVTSVVPGGRRTAVAQLSGWAKIGTPLCPSWVKLVVPHAKKCAVNATGADDLSLATGLGTLSGTFAVVVQGDNLVDAPEFVIMTGTFKGDADLSLSLAGVAPLGYITNGVAAIDVTGDGQPDLTFNFSGTFRLPFALDLTGRYQKWWRGAREAFYLGDNYKPIEVKDNERSLGMPTVRLEINF